MLTRGSWSALFSRADSIGGLASIALGLGFSAPAPLDDGTRQALGIPDEFQQPHIAAGTGALRALLVVSADDRPIRDQVMRAAARLTGRAPHLLWLLLVATTSDEIVIATWLVGGTRPKVAALIIDRSRILASDLETTMAVAAACAVNDLLVHARWHELLGREALSNRFYFTLERLILEAAEHASGRANEDDRREIALLNVSRLLFLAFLESKGWLDADRGFLTRIFDDCMEDGGSFQRRILLPLFFGTLNTRLANRAAPARAFGRIPFLNGGLFQRSPAESRCRHTMLRDEDWGRLYADLLQRYRFTAREESGEWNEAAIDPEMLGRAFESLMTSRDRRTHGAFFTPHSLVERITEAALEEILTSRGADESWLRAALRGEQLDVPAAAGLRAAIGGVRILDPACGSGAFLVHALERLTILAQAAGDVRQPHLIRRDVLTQRIFGVDINPTAVWLCELRLWLAMVLDDEETDPVRVAPLPNLDHNIRCGDSLAGGDFSVAPQGGMGAQLAGLRTRYARATGARKRGLARVLQRRERAETRGLLSARLACLAAERRALLIAARGRDLFGGRRGSLPGEREALSSLRARTREIRAQLRGLTGGGAVPFAFAAHFPDVAASGGFDIVIGNPPWVRVHRIPPEGRDRLRREFVTYRDAAWEAGARDARAGRGFAAQIDLAALFVERSMALTRPGGAVAMLIPAKLWRSLAGGGVRRLLHDRNALRVLEDWTEAPAVFDAAVYPALVVARRAAESPSREPGRSVRMTAHRGSLAVSWSTPAESIPLEATRGAPWLVLPPDARASFDRLIRNGVSLVASGIGTPALGVKCGCNEAFLASESGRRGSCAYLTSGSRSAAVEAAFVRPVLRGEGLRAWRATETSDRIVYPYADDDSLLRVLPPGVRRWLTPFRRSLAQRADARGSMAWWSLFRTESARRDRPRVVWADVARAPLALVLPEGDRTVAINSCYVMRCRDVEDAFTIAALLNSALAAAWLGALAEPARGGYRRFLAWTVARLPLPDDWQRTRRLLAPLGERGFAGAPPARGELLDAVLDAYRVRSATMMPLLGWMSR